MSGPPSIWFELLPSAVKELAGLATKRLRRQVAKRIGSLAADPRPRGSEKLSGQEKYRVRQGPWRIAYSIDEGEKTVLVVKVGHRRDVYR